MSEPSRLAGSAWPDLDPSEHLLAVPLGATEQHGRHLPVDTDTVIAVALAEELSRRRPGVVVAPALPVGASGEHAGFPGTLSVGRDALRELLVELVRSADDWAGVVLVNWHGGNAEAVRGAVAQLAGEERDVVVGPGALPAGDAHAGRTETSLMLALAPDRVRIADAVPGDTRPLAALMPALRTAGVRAVSESGVLGDPAGASAQEGRRLFAALADDLVARVDGAHPRSDDRAP